MRRIQIFLILTGLLLVHGPWVSQDQPGDVWLAGNAAQSDAGQKTELVTDRSRFARVFQVSPETRMMQVFTAPIYYRDESGKWQAIDTRVVPSTREGFGLEVTRNDYKVYFRESLISPHLVRYEAKGASIEFGLEAHQPWGNLSEVQAVATGNQVVYADPYPGISLRYTLSPQQMLEEFIVADRALASRLYQINKRFIPDADVDWKIEADGSITFTKRGTSDRLWEVPRPVLYELEHPQEKSYGVHFEVVKAAGYFSLIKVIEPAGRLWLNNRHRQFPVVVDDTVVLNDSNLAGGEGTIQTDGSVYQRITNNPNLAIGLDPTPGLTYRGFLEWDTTAIPAGAVIQSVGVYFHVSHYYGTGNTVNILQLSQPISSYPNNNAGNQKLFSDIQGAPIYRPNLNSFQYIASGDKGDRVISFGYDTYAFNTAVSDLQSKLATHAPYGIALMGSNESNDFTTLLTNADTTDPTEHPALIVFYGGIKGSDAAMVRPLRNSFYDGHDYWAFFRADKKQVAYSSPDGIMWTRSAELSTSDNQHNSEWYEPSQTVWAAYAAKVVDPFTDMVLKKGTITYSPAPAILWSNPTTVFTATRSPTTDGYDFPSVITDSNGGCWLMARHVTTATSEIEIAQSTDATCTAWKSSTSLFAPRPNGGDSGVGAYVVPLTNGNVYAVYKNQCRLEGKLYDGAAWAASPELIDQNAAFGVYSQGMSIVAVGDVVHLVYIGGDGSLKYNSWQGGWGTAITLAAGGSLWSPSVSLDTSTNSLYVIYRTSSDNSLANGAVYVQKGVSPYRIDNWSPATAAISASYSPETVFGAVSPGSVSPWSLSTNYSGQGVNFAILVNGAYGVQLAVMNHTLRMYLPLIEK